MIDVTNLYKSDVKSFGYPQSYRKRNKISSLDTKLSFIESIRSFPLNIEAKHIKTYKSSDAKNGQISMLLNNSMILLPKKPMKRRYLMKELDGLQQVKLTMESIIKKPKLLLILTDGD